MDNRNGARTQSFYGKRLPLRLRAFAAGQSL